MYFNGTKLQISCFANYDITTSVSFDKIRQSDIQRVVEGVLGFDFTQFTLKFRKDLYFTDGIQLKIGCSLKILLARF